MTAGHRQAAQPALPEPAPAHPYHGLRHRTPAEVEAWTRLTQEAVLEPNLPIVDSHHHFYTDDRGPYALQDLLNDIDGNNVVATVYAEAKSAFRPDGPAELRSVGETEFAGAIAAGCADARVKACAGIVSFADLTVGEAVGLVLDAHMASSSRLRGIRYSAQHAEGISKFQKRPPPPHLLLDPRFRQGVAQLAQRGLIYESWQYFTQLTELLDLARAQPGTRIVINHNGGILGAGPFAGRQREIYDSWRQGMQALSQCPNVLVKLGGMGMIAFGGGFHLGISPPDSVELARQWRPYMQTTIDLFGPDRCMFESNFPPDKQSGSYTAVWNAFKRIAADYSPDEKRRLLAGTAIETYRLALD